MNPGKSFPVEWATGHKGSMGHFVLVHADDEVMLNAYNDKVMNAYIDGASEADGSTKAGATVKQVRWRGRHLICG